MKTWTKLAGLIVLSSVVALFAAYRTAFVMPMRLNGLSPAGETEADLIRHRYPLRLIQPEWMFESSSVKFNDSVTWVIAEVKARLGGILLVWALAIVALVRRFNSAASSDTAAFVVSIYLLSTLAMIAAYSLCTSPPAAGGIHANTFDPKHIREMFPIRLIQPEWVSPNGNRTVNWIDAEMKARFSMVFMIWTALIGSLSWAFRARNDNRLA